MHRAVLVALVVAAVGLAGCAQQPGGAPGGTSDPNADMGRGSGTTPGTSPYLPPEGTTGTSTTPGMGPGAGNGSMVGPGNGSMAGPGNGSMVGPGNGSMVGSGNGSMFGPGNATSGGTTNSTGGSSANITEELVNATYSFANGPPAEVSFQVSWAASKLTVHTNLNGTVPGLEVLLRGPSGQEYRIVNDSMPDSGPSPPTTTVVWDNPAPGSWTFHFGGMGPGMLQVEVLLGG